MVSSLRYPFYKKWLFFYQCGPDITRAAAYLQDLVLFVYYIVVLLKRSNTGKWTSKHHPRVKDMFKTDEITLFPVLHSQQSDSIYVKGRHAIQDFDLW